MTYNTSQDSLHKHRCNLLGHFPGRCPAALIIIIIIVISDYQDDQDDCAGHTMSTWTTNIDALALDSNVQYVVVRGMVDAVLTHQYSWDDIGTLGGDLSKENDKISVESK